MAAISLYKGNLHCSPDVPHQLLVPKPYITLKDFKTLLQRRSKALSRFQATILNPNPNVNSTEDANSDEILTPKSDGPNVNSTEDAFSLQTLNHAHRTEQGSRVAASRLRLSSPVNPNPPAASRNPKSSNLLFIAGGC